MSSPLLWGPASNVMVGPLSFAVALRISVAHRTALIRRSFGRPRVLRSQRLTDCIAMKTLVLSAAALFGTAVAVIGQAQESPLPVLQASTTSDATASNSVLDRKITVHLDRVTLHDALAAIATQAHVTLA